MQVAHMVFRKDDVPTPVYYQLQVEIKDKIENGEWAPGSMIPTERTFTDQYKVSIGTVKKALTNLVNDGYLNRIQGKGTFVTGTSLRREKLRYYRLYEGFFDETTPIDVTLLDITILKGNSAINKNLKLKTNQNLFCVRRILSSHTSPLIYSISYLAQKQFKGLDTLPKDTFEKELFYLMLEAHFGIPTIFNRELISAVAADKETAELLKVKKNTPLTHIEMLSYTYKEIPYEYRLSYCQTQSQKVFREY